MGFMDMFMGSPGTPGEHGIDVAYIDEYDDYAGIRSNLIDYYTGIMQGQEPSYMQNYLPQIEKQQEQEYNRMYLGDPGQRQTSAFGQAAQTGAMTGVGPKATVSNQGQVGNELAAKKAAAKAAMAKYKMDWMGGAQWNATQGMASLPRNPTYEAFGWQTPGTPGSEGFLSKMASMAGGQIMDNFIGDFGTRGGGGGTYDNTGRESS